MDPPTDMTLGSALAISTAHYIGEDYGSLLLEDADYAVFRADRLMPPIGDRLTRVTTGTARVSASRRTATGRGGGRSSLDHTIPSPQIWVLRAYHLAVNTLGLRAVAASVLLCLVEVLPVA